MLTTKKHVRLRFFSPDFKENKVFRTKLLLFFDNNRLAKVRLLSESANLLSFFFRSQVCAKELLYLYL